MDTEVIWENILSLTETDTVTYESFLNKEIRSKFQSDVIDTKCILIKNTYLPLNYDKPMLNSTEILYNSIYSKLK